ncbi:MAG: hypothetical protein K2F94_01745, partial [Muribaculaceae bacterium]|nr:hypothetical protein [Muribaculaceae bacterium]
MRQLLFFAIATTLSICFLCQCDGRHDARLARIASTIDSLPQAAIDSLAEIDSALLSDADKNLHILLLTKARDKAFVRHSSDSSILKAVRFYENDPKNPLYPEALFYAGRVYNDMGDYPTSLEYYLQALAALPDTPDNIHLRGLIISHLGWTFNELRLYHQAIPYFKESIRIDSLERNLSNLIYDSQLLGAVYTSLDSLDKAQSILESIVDLSDDTEIQAHVRTFLAGVMRKKGDIPGALKYIRGTVENAAPTHRNVSLSYACDIYYRAGILDTAYLYARDLAFNNDETNRKNGFKILLSSGIRERLPVDTIVEYVIKYREVMEQYLYRYDRIQTINQTSRYNYQKHVKDKETAQLEKSEIWNDLLYCIIAIICLVGVLIIRESRRNRLIIKLVKKIEKYKLIKEIIKLSAPETREKEIRGNSDTNLRLPDSEKKPVAPLYPETTDDTGLNLAILSDNPAAETEKLRKKFQSEILEMAKSTNIPVSPAILESEPFHELQDMIKNGLFLDDSNPLWERIEKTVTEVSPRFKDCLSILIGGSPRPLEWRTAL